MLGDTEPDSCTAAAAPVVEYETTVVLPSAHVLSELPLVVLLLQLPLPLGTGSW
jgi:hypothetical protein